VETGIRVPSAPPRSTRVVQGRHLVLLEVTALLIVGRQPWHGHPVGVCMSSRGPRNSGLRRGWWSARPGVFFGGDGSRVCMGGAEPGGWWCGRLGWRLLRCPAGAARSFGGRARAWLGVSPGDRAVIMMATGDERCPARDRSAGRCWRRGLSAVTGWCSGAAGSSRCAAWRLDGRCLGRVVVGRGLWLGDRGRRGDRRWLR
jgi:hypothetical protein